MGSLCNACLGCVSNMYCAPGVVIEEVIVVLVLLPYTAVTLTVQLLPALREVMVWVVTDPLTVSDDDRYSSETHNNWQE